MKRGRRGGMGSALYTGFKSRHTRRSDADHDYAYEVQKARDREAKQSAGAGDCAPQAGSKNSGDE